MPSLAQLLASHRRILVLDASSAQVQVGLLTAGPAGDWETPVGEAGNAVFEGAAALLEKAGIGLEAVDAFAFCEGPGSMLGIRTVALTLRVWTALKPRPVYAYQSLAIAAHGEHRRSPRALSVIADARRGTWHVQSITREGTLDPLARVPELSLPMGEKLTPVHFRAWAPLPAGTTTCCYELAVLLPTAAATDLFRESASPDALQPAPPDYRKWSAQVHSSETMTRR